MGRRVDVVRLSVGESRGTGFLLDAQRVLTALHVVGRLDQGRLVLHGPSLRITAAVTDGASFRFPVSIPTIDDIKFDETRDWACIQVKGAFSGVVPLPVGELKDEDEGSCWNTYGFPDSCSEEGKATAGTITSVAAILDLGGRKVTAIQLFSREAGAGMGGVVHGFSGAPVIVDGRIVGILCGASVNVQTGRSDEGTLYAIPLYTLGVPLPTVECPYPGLRPFEQKDAPRFFGREAETDDVVRQVGDGHRQILVVGPSGSGKSSFVKAGVVPNLAYAEGQFELRTVRPGPLPADALLKALGTGATPKNAVDTLLSASMKHALLIVIDQLEELFTLCEDRRARQEFVEAYKELRKDRRCTVIMTFRADFWSDLMESALWPLVSEETVRKELAPLHGESLAKAIVSPARAVGVTIKPELRERLLADVASEPGALPLLQETLRTLWNKRSRGALRLEDYVAMGDGEGSGLAVALEQQANKVLDDFRPTELSIAWRTFIRLMSFGEGRADTRRQQSIASLRATGDPPKGLERVLEKLASERLLTRDTRRDGDTIVEIVDIAHEALITAWPALVTWTKSRRLDEQNRRKLEMQADEWVRHGQGAVALLGPKLLDEAESWVDSKAGQELGRSEHLANYLRASRQAERQRQRRKIRILLLAVFLPIVAIATTLFVSYEGWLVPRPDLTRAVIPEGYVSQKLSPSAAQTQDRIFIKEFTISVHEITNRDYAQFLRGTRGHVPDSARFRDPAFSDHPVVGVTWHEATAFADWVKGRLPTEAEWEKAASWDPRSRAWRKYPWGDAWDDTVKGVDESQPVGVPSKDVSVFGVQGMVSNVAEWTSSRAEDHGISDGPTQLSGDRVVKGYAWASIEETHSPQTYVTHSPNARDSHIGFRVVWDRQ